MPGVAERPAGGPSGWAILDELRDRLTADELEASLRAFAALEGPDRSSQRLRATTGQSIDLSIRAHREALLDWLRAWGCRHLRRADTPRSSRALTTWWERHAGDLPSPGVPLTDLGGEALAHLGVAYASLARTPAATRTSGRGPIAVSFGDTAAAKALFALRPEAVPPWDEPIRRSFGWDRADPERFAAYLAAVRDAIAGLAQRLGCDVGDLSPLLGRPRSPPVKIVDELLWLRVTRGARGPTN